MEGAADLQRHAAPGALFLGQGGGLLHGGLVAADDQLARAVVVGDDHAARVGGLLAGRLEGFPVQVQDRHHGALPAGSGRFHGLAPEGHQLNGGLGVKDAGGVEGGVLAQGKAGGHGGADALLRPARR